MEDLFRSRPGIKDTEVGYQGGENDNPTYHNHPGHAESIEITELTNFIYYKVSSIVSILLMPTRSRWKIQSLMPPLDLNQLKLVFD